MCGIAGILSYSNRSGQADKIELRKIRDHMESRGPDGYGEWSDQDGRIILGHRRLSIIDLSPRSDQPMVSGCGQYVITYNGEIYNYIELRNSMQQQGCIFKTGSDTEVVLELFKKKGLKMFDDLKGMYALSIWNKKTSQLILARDPHGIKPLYYSNSGKVLKFSSQVKSLIAGGKISKNRDPAAEVGFYLFGSIPEPYTKYTDIRQLEAGTVLIVSEKGLKTASFSSGGSGVPSNVINSDVSMAVEDRRSRVRECLRESVTRHLVSDVPVGLFLSAGLDSTTLAGILSDVQRRPLKTITLAFSEFRNSNNDESILAEKVSEYYGTDHTTRYIDEAELKQDLPNILSAMDQPSIDGFNTWFASKVAAESGLKVAMSGLGADELLGGYPSFVDIPRWTSLHRYFPESIREILGKILAGFSMAGIVHPKIPSLIMLANEYPGAYLVKRGLFMPHELDLLMGRDKARAGLEQLKPLDLINKQIRRSDLTPFSKVSRLESSLYMRNQLLRDADWAGMAHSLEIRTPFVDHTLSSCLTGVLDKAYGKAALLRSVANKELPDSVYKRKKTGFTLPFHGWLGRIKELDDWKSVPLLQKNNCHWSRRLAYVVNNNQ